MRRPLAVAVLAATVWGLCFVFIKASAPGPVPLLHAGLRSSVGGAVLLVWSRLRTGAPPRVTLSSRPTLPSRPALVALAVLNSVLALGAMYLAAGRAEAAVSSILGGGQPLVLAVAGWLLFRERITARTVAGLALAVAGIAAIATTSAGPTRLDGVLLSLAAAVAPAIGTVAMRRLGPGIDLVATTGVQFALGGAVLLALSALVEPWSRGALTAGVVADVLVQGVVGTGLAYVAWFWVVGRLPLAQLGPILYLVPITGLAFAVLAGERLAPAEAAGSLAVLAGVLVASLAPTGRLGRMPRLSGMRRSA